jgi:hypothetical protein
VNFFASKILIDAAMQLYNLPDMKISDKYSCNKGQAIVSVKNYKDESACLMSAGYLGVLQKLNTNK